MPTSAPGDKARRGGFTLVELLVVMLLFGLLSAVVVVAMPDPRGSLRDEAERFAARARAVQEQAIVGGAATALRVTAAGYGFDRRQRGAWVPVGGEAFADRAWPAGVAVGVAGPARIAFDPTGLAEPAEIRLTHGGDAAGVRIAADGSVTILD